MKMMSSPLTKNSMEDTAAAGIDAIGKYTVFNVIESEGTIASTTAGIVKEIARDLKKNGKVREYKW